MGNLTQRIQKVGQILPQSFNYRSNWGNKITDFIRLIHLPQWTISYTSRPDCISQHQKKKSCAVHWQDPVMACICRVTPHISFLSKQCDVIASFSLVHVPAVAFLKWNIFLLNTQQIHLFIMLIRLT